MPPRIGDKQRQLLVPEFGAEQYKVDRFGPQTFQSAEEVRRSGDCRAGLH